MLLFMDGFDHYATADLFRKWDALALGNGDVWPTSGRRGTGCFRSASGSGGSSDSYLTKNLPSQPSTIIVGFAVHPYATGSITDTTDSNWIVRFYDGVTFAGGLWWYGATKQIGLIGVGGVTALTDGIAANPYPLSVWYYVEVRFTIASAVTPGMCQVRVNGEIVIDATGGSTQPAGDGLMDMVRFGAKSGNYEINFLYDDLYICDTTGTMNNDFLGDVRIDTYAPNADGSLLEWTPTPAGTHYTTVDESPPSWSDYISADVTGARDLFTITPLSELPGSILGVRPLALARKTTAGFRSLKHSIKIGATTYNHAQVSLSDTSLYSGEIFETSPADNTPWTPAKVAAAEFGVELV